MLFAFLFCFWVTPLKMNIEHKSNEALEDDFPFPGLYSQLPCLIFRGVANSPSTSSRELRHWVLGSTVKTSGRPNCGSNGWQLWCFVFGTSLARHGEHLGFDIKTASSHLPESCPNREGLSPKRPFLDAFAVTFRKGSVPAQVFRVFTWCPKVSGRLFRG